jgi:hypothetical protein
MYLTKSTYVSQISIQYFNSQNKSCVNPFPYDCQLYWITDDSRSWFKSFNSYQNQLDLIDEAYPMRFTET